MTKRLDPLTMEEVVKQEADLSAELKEVHYKRRLGDGGYEFDTWKVLIMTK